MEKINNLLKDFYIKIANFCAYQERTQKEVRDKLYGYGLSADSVEYLISCLIEENFINEERFAKVYAGSKFRVKKWGRIKVLQALKQKGLSSYCIEVAMKEIEDDDYQKALEEIIEKKASLLKETNSYIFKNKLAQYALTKGYESDLVWELINRLVK
jgi:regulatory protein